MNKIKSARFLMMPLVLLVLTASCFDQQVAAKNPLPSDMPVFEIMVSKARAKGQRTLDDLMLLFGDKLPVSGQCYQAAVSNYIDDNWDVLAKAEACPASEVPCGSMLRIMGRFNDLLAGLNKQLDPENGIASFSKADPLPGPKDLTKDEVKTKADELNAYVNSCGSRSPAPWSVAGAPLGEWKPALVKLSFEQPIIENLIAARLSAEEKGYVGCVDTLNSVWQAKTPCIDLACANLVPVDTKQDLQTRLDELKDHQCATLYAIQTYKPLTQ